MKAYDAMKRAGSTSWSSFTMAGSLTTRRSKPRTVGSSLLVFLGGSSQFDDQDRMGGVPEAGQGSDSVLVHRLGLQLHGA